MIYKTKLQICVCNEVNSISRFENHKDISNAYCRENSETSVSMHKVCLLPTRDDIIVVKVQNILMKT